MGASGLNAASAVTCGFLVLDKPAGLSSHSCVSRVRRAYGLKRVGHGGTLDPAVTGVLPIALGPATRLLPYLSGDKTYRGIIQLGVRTDSDDLEAALDRFRGTIKQRPPAVSAVHVNGERAYKLARAGVALELPTRSVSVHHLTLLSWTPDQGQLELEVACSAGTYIRSIARDLGDALGCGGALAQLRRTEALGFGLQQSVSLEQLDQEPRPLLVDPLNALAHLPRHPLEPEQLQGWRCGRLQDCDPSWEPDTAVVVVSPDGNLAGMARVQATGTLQPRLVLDAAG